MKQYHKLLNHILENGVQKGDRTGTGTISTFGYQMRFDLSKGFPMLTTKKLHLKSIIHELLWFIKGETNIKYLNDNNVKIWDSWADENGNLGPVYGHQWRNWNSDGIDQISILIDQIKNNPNSRRMIVSAWNPSVLPDTSKSFSENVSDNKAALPPCHAFFQFYVSDGKLSCHAIKRIRSNKDKTLRNKYQHKSARTAIQKLRETSDKKEASSLLVFVSSMIDKLVKKNIIHKNKASNLKSKLTKKVNAL